MTKTIRRVISVLLCVLLLLGCGAVSGFAADTSGSCGVNMTWEYDAATGTLIITGSGDMTDFYAYSAATTRPWDDYKFSIRAIEFVSTDSGITSLGYGAFRDCSLLTTCSIPDTVTGIGTQCFSGCSSLQSIEVPGGVKTLPLQTFYNCTALQTVTLHEGLTEIGDSAFYHCDSLSAIEIPTTVTTIDMMAFGNTPLTEVYLPDSVSVLGDSAFSFCESLQKVRLPQNENFTKIDQYTFDWCESLTEITIPDSVTVIGREAFCGCSKLPSINIPDGVTTIGQEAFQYCEAIESFAVPASVTEIGEGAFSSCPAVTSLTVAENNPVYCSKGNCIIDKADGTLMFGCNSSVIPDDGSVTSIAESAFMYCSGLESVVIPDSVTSIGTLAFAMCTALKSVTIPANVTELGLGAFMYCFSLGNIVFNTDHLTSIGESTFSYCFSLKSIVIPNGVRQIGDDVFSSCVSLKSVTLPHSLTENVSSEYTIGEGAFSLAMPEDAITELQEAYEEMVAAGLDEMEGIPISVIETVLAAGEPQISDLYFAGDVLDWMRVVSNIGGGNDALTAAQLHFSFNPLAAVENGTARFDTEKGVVYGLQPFLTAPEEYFHAAEGFTVDVTPSMERDGQPVYGTGSTVYVYDENDLLVDQYTLAIIGDVDGDGVYDAMDAYIANLLMNLLLPYNTVSGAQIFASDVNGDGQCNESDVAILRQAGLLLAQIEQGDGPDYCGPGDSNLDSVMLEYLGLIDQTLEDVEPQPEAADPAPEAATLTIRQLVDQLLRFLETCIMRLFRIVF